MVGVPFLRLALLPQIEILKHVDNKELFFLSLISTRCKNLAKTAKRSIKDVKLHFKKEEQMLITVRELSDWTTKTLIGLRKKTKKTTFRGSENMDIRSLNIEQGKGPIVFYGEGSYHEMEHRIIRHLFSVFKKVEKVSVVLEDVANVSSNAFWKYSKNLYCLNISLQKVKLSDEEVSFLFDELTVSDTCFFSAPTQGFKYQKGFKHNRMDLKIPQSKYPNVDAIISSESSSIKIKCSLPPATELNRFLKEWDAGENMKNLEWFTIGNRESVPGAAFKAKVLEGITVTMDYIMYVEISSIDGRRGFVRWDYSEFHFGSWN